MRKINLCFSVLFSLATLFGCCEYVKAADSAIVALSESKSGDTYTISATVDPNGTTVCSLFSTYDFDNSKLIIQSITLGDTSFQNATSGSFDVSTINTNSSITANLGFPGCKTTSFTAFSFTAIAGSNLGDVLISANSLSIMGGSDGMQTIDFGYDMPAVIFSTVVDTPAVAASSSTSSSTTTSSSKTTTKKTSKAIASTTSTSSEASETQDSSNSSSQEIVDTPQISNGIETEDISSQPVTTASTNTNKNSWPKYLFGAWGAAILVGVAVLLYKRKKPSLRVESPVAVSTPAQEPIKTSPDSNPVPQTEKKEMPIFGPKGNFVYSDLKPVHAKHWA